MATNVLKLDFDATSIEATVNESGYTENQIRQGRPQQHPI